MPDKLEKLIKLVYKKWKSDHPAIAGAHPDEEAFACFLEGRLSKEESEQFKAHLISCAACTEILTTQLGLEAQAEKPVPAELIAQVKNLLKEKNAGPILEIILALKEKALEILETSGDVLVGQELVPAPVLRSRKIKEFKDEVTILKDCGESRVEIKIENKGTQAFNFSVIVKEKTTSQIIRDLRITLLKEDLELESRLSNTGKVIFEHVLLGKYTIEISSPEEKLASILIDIRK